MRRIVASLAFLLASLTPVLAQGFNPAQAPPWVYADNYGRWAIQGQQANTYTFQVSGVSPCSITQLNYGNSSTFYAFADNVALAPVLIQDNNQANSEVVLPGSYLAPTQSTCGPALAPVNSHTTFSLQSGTGGLQEAINAVGTGSTAKLIYLSKEWYGLVNGIAGNNSTLAQSTTPSKVISSVTCSAGVTVVDITTVPATTYGCNPLTSKLLTPTQAPAGFPNLGVSSFSNIAAPTALSTAAASAGLITSGTTGGTIPASSTYRFGATCVDAAGGETTLSIDTASAATLQTSSGSTNTLSVTSPAGCTTANGAVGWRLYMTAASGSSLTEILYSPVFAQTSSTNNLQTVLNPATVIPIGQTATITAIITGTATVPKVSSAWPRSNLASASYPPFTAGGTVATTATGTMAIINFPAGYLNVLGRSVQFCGNANATTNATPGTLTFKAVLSSIYGVTAITPLSIVSGTTTASAQVQFPFCVTFTTAATGASGTLWVHGWADFDLAGNGVGVEAQDFIYAVSSAVDLTKQDTLSFTITPTTTGTTAFQMTQLSAYPSN